MKLPQAVQYCITSLEAAGFRAFAVGGCVRDSLLGLTPADFDLCTSATPEQIAQVFVRHQLLHHGEKHGTVGVVLDGEVFEITTFRTEGGYEDSRHPDWVDFVEMWKPILPGGISPSTLWRITLPPAMWIPSVVGKI